MPPPPPTHTHTHTHTHTRHAHSPTHTPTHGSCLLPAAEGTRQCTLFLAGAAAAALVRPALACPQNAWACASSPCAALPCTCRPLRARWRCPTCRNAICVITRTVCCALTHDQCVSDQGQADLSTKTHQSAARVHILLMLADTEGNERGIDQCRKPRAQTTSQASTERD